MHRIEIVHVGHVEHFRVVVANERVVAKGGIADACNALVARGVSGPAYVTAFAGGVVWRTIHDVADTSTRAPDDDLAARIDARIASPIAVEPVKTARRAHTKKPGSAWRSPAPTAPAEKPRRGRPPKVRAEAIAA